MNWNSKTLWGNIIAILLAIIGYFIDKAMFPSWAPWFGLFVVVLNMVAGMIQSQAIKKLKGQVAECKARFNYQPK